MKKQKVDSSENMVLYATIKSYLFYLYKIIFIIIYRFFESLSSGYNPRNRHFDRVFGALFVSSFLIFEHFAIIYNDLNSIKYILLILLLNTGCFLLVKNELFTDFHPSKKVILIFKIIIVIYFLIIQYLFYSKFVLGK